MRTLVLMVAVGGTDGGIGDVRCGGCRFGDGGDVMVVVLMPPDPRTRASTLVTRGITGICWY